MRKLVILILTIISLFIIYQCFDHNKVNYVSISDNSINNYYNYNDYLYKYLTDNNRLLSFTSDFVNNDSVSLYKDLFNNRTIVINNKEYYFKKVLRESDFVVINVGMSELSHYYNKYDMNKNIDFFNNLYSNIELLVKEIRKYAKGTVIFIGLYNPTKYYDASVDQLFYDMDIKLSKLMLTNDIHYIDLYELVKGNNYQDSNCFLNNSGHYKLSRIIEFYME